LPNPGSAVRDPVVSGDVLGLSRSKPFSRNRDWLSLLSQAVATRALLDHNAKLKVVNKRGLTPLGDAVAAGHAECAAALVAAGADESHRRGGFSLLHVAAGVGKEGTLMWLLDRGADVNDAANAEGYTPLHSAALSSDIACVRALVEAGGKLDAVGADGATPAALVNQKAKGGKELLELLGGRDAARRPAGSTAVTSQPNASSSRGARDAFAAGGPAGGPAPAAAFAAMSEPDQLRRVRRWAEAPAEEFRQLLDGFQPEVRARVADVRKLLQLITIHKACLRALTKRCRGRFPASEASEGQFCGAGIPAAFVARQLHLWLFRGVFPFIGCRADQRTSPAVIRQPPHIAGPSLEPTPSTMTAS